MRDEREKNKIESYSNRGNMHGYCSNIVYVQYYRWTDVGKFWAKMCKIVHFFYFTSIEAIALNIGHTQTSTTQR